MDRRLSGRVLEADTRRPIAGVEIAAGERTQKTARDGSFEIDVAAHRTLAVRARKGKRTTLHHEVSVPRADAVLEIAIPRHKLPARKLTDVVLGDGRNERTIFDAGESVLATARGLEPATAVQRG
jgi:ferric-dicitrate binding protein FerR (iron transport regulator)